MVILVRMIFLSGQRGQGEGSRASRRHVVWTESNKTKILTADVFFHPGVNFISCSRESFANFRAKEVVRELGRCCLQNARTKCVYLRRTKVPIHPYKLVELPARPICHFKRCFYH